MIKYFKDFLNESIRWYSGGVLTKDENYVDPNDLKGRVFVFSGVRDSNLEDEILRRGGVVRLSVSGKTTDLITNRYPKETLKLRRARDFGINIMDVDQFKRSLNKI